MIQLNNINLSFGSRDLFKNLNWHIKPGKRIGLFGPNGVGKTTLLNLLAGEFEPDSGVYNIPPSHVIGYLPQEVEETNTDKTVVEEALLAFEDILKLEEELEVVRGELHIMGGEDSQAHKRLILRLDEINTELVTRNSHTVRYDTEKLLMGLGFNVEDLERPLNTFSGGWRMRVALSKLLLVKPDVLLLDEPTNHLDIESIEWLEKYLEGFLGTVILVSHDQYFLNRMVTTIAELDNGQITEYAGNYSSYLAERKGRISIQKAAYENQQRKIKETDRFIERFRYKNTKARQVQSRIKMLEKLERIPLPRETEAAISFKFPEPKRSGKIVVDLSEFSKTYQNEDGTENEVFTDAGPLVITRGDKIALIGKNGAGKSTLARIIIGTESFVGEKNIGHNVEVTYFAQHQAEALNNKHTIFEELESMGSGRTETEIRSLLGAFLFTGDDVFKPIGVLSGGEKSRVALAKTLLSPKNFLILDEPTNHLDIQSRNVLVESLKQYKGTFVVVSHDRHFLNRITNKIWYAENGGIINYPGTYSEFRYHQERILIRDNDGTLGTSGKYAGDKNYLIDGSKTETQSIVDKREEAERRNLLYRELKEQGIENMENWRELTVKQLESGLSELEGKIHSFEEVKVLIEEAMANPEHFSDKDKARETSHKYNEIIENLAKLYERWESISAFLEIP